MTKTLVLIQVDNGVATYEVKGDVEVEVVDWDVIDQGDEDVPELGVEFKEAFPDVEEALDEMRKERGG